MDKVYHILLNEYSAQELETDKEIIKLDKHEFRAFCKEHGLKMGGNYLYQANDYIFAELEVEA